MESHFQYCLNELQGSDVYPALLYLSKADRASASALYAFKSEIDKISHIVKEPMAGEVRLQWWRDVLLGGRGGEAEANPIAKSVLKVVAQNKLATDGFDRFLEAKLFDLYNDPMPDQTSFEAYCGETESFFLQMLGYASGIKGSEYLNDLCGHGGVAIGISKTLLRLPYDSNLQKIYIPTTLIEEQGLATAHWLAADWTGKHEAVVRNFCEIGEKHLKKALVLTDKLSKQEQGMFLQLVSAKQIILKAGRSKQDFRAYPLQISPLSSQIALLKASLFGLPEK